MLLINISIINIIANTTIIQKATSFNSIDFSKHRDYLKFWIFDFWLKAFLQHPAMSASAQETALEAQSQK